MACTEILERTVTRIFFTAFDEPDRSDLIHHAEPSTFLANVYDASFVWAFYEAGAQVYNGRSSTSSIEDPARALLSDFSLDRRLKRGISYVINKHLTEVYAERRFSTQSLFRFRNALIDELLLDRVHHQPPLDSINHFVVDYDEETGLATGRPTPSHEPITITDSSDDDLMDTHEDPVPSSSSSSSSNPMSYDLPAASLSTDSLFDSPLSTSVSSYEGPTTKKPIEYLTAPSTVPSPEPITAPLVTSNTFSAVVELPGYGNYAINIDSSGLRRPSQIIGFRLD
ncbi:hypothetical protein SISNIDRAFT_487464 [Sistotremastrum niveocremeum HHB9708]|uniref:Uncharacterized protein n=1 Tax=Sistotremastrum niveocremeum HHB9708 TaxID=1314777 RepID=A0A164SHN8_9AGAM|nr:hypothetical protein SISNIDRAFT_487464 [Sistotremastrum niveocremeum HHB9708]